MNIPCIINANSSNITDSKEIVVFSPILPQSSDLNHIASKFDKYTQHFTVKCVDTVSIVMGCSNMQQAGDKFAQYVKESCKNAKIIMGIALGGTMLQYVADNLCLSDCDLVFISSPCYADIDLIEQLNRLIELLKKQNLLETLNLLEMIVNYSYSQDKKIQNLDFIQNETNTIKRLLCGFNLMIQADARNNIQRTNNKYHILLGEFSKLATRNNIYCANCDCVTIISQAGMRVFDENLPEVLSALDQIIYKHKDKQKHS